MGKGKNLMTDWMAADPVGATHFLDHARAACESDPDLTVDEIVDMARQFRDQNPDAFPAVGATPEDTIRELSVYYLLNGEVGFVIPDTDTNDLGWHY